MISQAWRNALVGQIDNVLFLASLIVRSKCAWLTVTVRMAAVCETLPILLLNMYALNGGLAFGGFGVCQAPPILRSPSVNNFASSSAVTVALSCLFAESLNVE